jgi:tetratricopeptide (TPR) repeat protein
MGDGGDRGSRAFVGRDREVAELLAGLRDAVGGRGRLFLITGEPGIGKTWLAEYVAERALELDVRVLWGRCWEGGGAPPFRPWTQLIGALVEGNDERKLADWLGGRGAQIARVVPSLAERFGGPAVPAAGSSESDAARFYLFDAVTSLIRRAAAVQPLLLVLDDLHAADNPSLLLLQFLARHLRGARLLVLATYRDVPAVPASGAGDVLAELVREGQLLQLQGLDRAEVRGLIEALSGSPPSEAKLSAVHERTEGNPLFVRELVRLLTAEAAPGRPGRLGRTIPGSVRAVIERRLAPLSADAVQVLAAAAVAGRDFDISLVGPACELPAERVIGALSEAVAQGIVAEEVDSGGGYRFSHSLIREVLYARLPVPIRMQLHRRLGEVIERLDGGGSGSHVAELSRHFAEVAAAGEAAKALTYAQQAGDRAMGMHAYEEAAAEYQRALLALRLLGWDDALGCELLLHQGSAQARAGHYEQAGETYLRAAELSRTLRSPERLARAALGFGERQVEAGLVNRPLVALLREALDGLDRRDDPLRARLLARLSLEFTFTNETSLTMALSQDAVAMARRLADPDALRDAIDARWMAVWGPDGLSERTALADEILRLAWDIGDRGMEMEGRLRRAASSLESGDFPAVQADIAAHARLTEEIPMAVHRWAAMTMHAMRALLAGSFEEAEEVAGEALNLQPARPNVLFTHIDQVALLRWEQGRLGSLRDEWQTVVDRFPGAAFARVWLGLADADLGDRDAARRGLRSVVEHLPRLPRNGVWLPSAALAALLCACLNDNEAADVLYPLLLPYAGHVIALTAPQPVVCLGSASFYLALLCSMTSRWTEAADHFEAALRVHDRLGARSLLARARYEYAAMLIRRGRSSDSSRTLRLLDNALATARTLGMAGVAEQIRTLVPARTGGPAPESARAAAPEVAGDLFRREGQYWTVRYEGSVAHLKDSKGLQYLARLLAHPAREFHVADLEAATTRTTRTAPAAAGERAPGGELRVRADLGDAGTMLDSRAKAAYRARLDELRAELDEAERFNDPGRAARAAEERDFLVGELARAVGLGGRDRRAASHAERARLNVTRAIRAAMVNLARANPALGRHLSSTIHTGRYCSYAPDPRAPVTWTF